MSSSDIVETPQNGSSPNVGNQTNKRSGSGNSLAIAVFDILNILRFYWHSNLIAIRIEAPRCCLWFYCLIDEYSGFNF